MRGNEEKYTELGTELNAIFIRFPLKWFDIFWTQSYVALSSYNQIKKSSFESFQEHISP